MFEQLRNLYGCISVFLIGDRAMYIGERIKYFRKRKGLTQKGLGILIGFPEETADTRIAQYEKSGRKPKEETLSKIADVPEVNRYSIDIPTVDKDFGVMHLLFLMEDIYGLTVTELNGKATLQIKPENYDQWRNADFPEKELIQWLHAHKKLEQGELTLDQYNARKYNYPSVVLFDENVHYLSGDRYDAIQEKSFF